MPKVAPLFATVVVISTPSSTSAGISHRLGRTDCQHAVEPSSATHSRLMDIFRLPLLWQLGQSLCVMDYPPTNTSFPSSTQSRPPLASTSSPIPSLVAALCRHHCLCQLRRCLPLRRGHCSIFRLILSHRCPQDLCQAALQLYWVIPLYSRLDVPRSPRTFVCYPIPSLDTRCPFTLTRMLFGFLNDALQRFVPFLRSTIVPGRIVAKLAFQEQEHGP